MRKYIILIKNNYILGTQIYTGNQFDNPVDDDFGWKDFTPTHYVGIFKGADEEEAILEASEEIGFNQEILEAIELI